MLLGVAILILMESFLQYYIWRNNYGYKRVAILILMESFLQYPLLCGTTNFNVRRNPYFNRILSAITDGEIYLRSAQQVAILILMESFLQYEGTREIIIGGQVAILILMESFLQ